MKKFVFLSFCFLLLPVYALCPLDGSNDSVCTLPEFRQQVTPMFKQSGGVPTNIDSTPGQLQPLDRVDPINQMRGTNNSTNYNSGCQFGVCLQNPKDSRLPDNRDIGN